MATATREEKTCRMDVRLTAEQRALFERAAQVNGMTLTQWSTMRLAEAARFDIEQASVTWLSPEHFDEFVAALNEPLPPKTIELLSSEPIWG